MSDEADVRREGRRQFLKQAGAVTGLSLGAGWAALSPPDWPLSLRDPDGERGKSKPRLERLPEGGFMLSDRTPSATMGIARGKRVAAMVEAAIDAIGGIGRFVQSGDVVVIKPNVAFERAAPLAATTNPEVLSALIHLVQKAGAVPFFPPCRR